MFFAPLFSIALVFLVTLSTSAHAHIVQEWPPAMASRFNAAVPETSIDYDVQGPLSSAAEFPCKLQHLQPQVPVATLTAGTTHNVTFVKQTADPHNFGSMQVALSYNGRDFYVIHSWQGQAADPARKYDFMVPKDAPTGKAIFSWSFVNKGGAREFYNACSSVTIAAAPKDAKEPAIPFNDRPDIFVAQLGNGDCMVAHDHDVLYPEPGPDEDVTTNIMGKSVKMTYGVCKPVNGIGNHPRGSASQPAKFVAATVPRPDQQIQSTAMTNMQPVHSLNSLASGDIVPSTTLRESVKMSTFPAAMPSGRLGLVESPDNRCGEQTNFKCPRGQCCSVYGYCGNNLSYCGIGKCQPDYGDSCDSTLGGPSLTVKIGKGRVVTVTITKTLMAAPTN